MWLNHYLLGKITHKLGYSPAIYLDHLYQSLQHLYEMYAVYPRLYYKIHALSIKYLLKYEDTPAPKDELRAIWQYIKKAGSSPFAKFQQKAELLDYHSPENDEESDETSEEEKATETSRQTKKRSLETDHDYYNAKKATS
ncbi:hypothetical protein MRX96_046323 [Rhipicephalus microplus]